MVGAEPKEGRNFNGKDYIMEEAITGDFSLVKGWKADKLGNVIFKKTARNFHPDLAGASKTCIVEVEEIVEPGELDPDHIHLPACFTHRIVKGEVYEKRVERRVIYQPGKKVEILGANKEARERIVKRATQEIKDGMYVNLGIGLPGFCSHYLSPEKTVLF